MTGSRIVGSLVKRYFTSLDEIHQKTMDMLGDQMLQRLGQIDEHGVEDTEQSVRLRSSRLFLFSL